NKLSTFLLQIFDCILNLTAMMNKFTHVVSAIKLARTISLFFFFQLILFASAYAQLQEVRGTVKDQNGNPLTGVTIKLKGTARTTITDNEGRYSITVPSASSVLE